MPRRAYRSRRPARRASTARNQSYTFRNIEVGTATVSTAADGTASRLTDLTTIIETTVSAPDIELNRALITRVVGRGIARPAVADTPMTYSYGLLIDQDTLDVADVDLNLAGLGGRTIWAHRSIPMIPNQHLRSLTGTTFENEIDSWNFSIRTRGSRRLKGFGQSLWFAESVQLQNLANCGWLFDITVEVA